MLATTVSLLQRSSLPVHLQPLSISVSLTASPAYPKRGFVTAHLGPLEPTEKTHLPGESQDSSSAPL